MNRELPIETLQTLAFEALPLNALRLLHARGVLRDIASNTDASYNELEFLEMCEKDDPNTTLYFALKNNLVNVAREMMRDNIGQTLILEYRDFKGPMRRNIAALILQRHTTADIEGGLYLSKDVIKKERRVLAANATLHSNQEILSELGTSLEELAEPMTFDSEIGIAMFEGGHFDLMKYESNSNEHPEMYPKNFVCLLDGPHYLSVIEKNKESLYDLATLPIQSHPYITMIPVEQTFICEAIYNGYFDVAFRAASTINFSFDKTHALEQNELFGASKYWREIFTAENFDKIMALGYQFQIVDAFRGACSSRNLDAIKYFMSRIPREILRGEINAVLAAAIKSESLYLVDLCLSDSRIREACANIRTGLIFTKIIMR